MVSRTTSTTTTNITSQEILHSSGASNSSSSTTPIPVAVDEPMMMAMMMMKQEESLPTTTATTTANNNSSTKKALSSSSTTAAATTTTMQLLRRSRNAMKLFHRSTGKGNSNNSNNNLNTINNNSIINGTTTTMENDNTNEKRDVAAAATTTTTISSSVRLESLYHGTITAVPHNDDDDDDNVVILNDNTIITTTATTTTKTLNMDTISNKELDNKNTNNNSNNNTLLQNEMMEILQQQQQSQPTTTNTVPLSGKDSNKGSKTMTPTTTTGAFCTSSSSTSSTLPFFDGICSINRTDSDDSVILQQQQEQKRHHQFHNSLPDDPSIQESIECIIMASQQQQQQQQQQKSSNATTKESNSEYRQVSENNSDSSNEQEWYTNRYSQQQQQQHQHQHQDEQQRPPSTIHQSLLKNRSLSRLPAQFQRDVMSRSPRSSLPLNQNNGNMQRVPPTFLFDEAAIEISHDKLDLNSKAPSTHQQYGHDTVHSKVGTTIIPSVQQDSTGSTPGLPPTEKKVTELPKDEICSCSRHHVPLIPPDVWPQRPLLLRPTPNGGTRIKGIRFVSSTEKDYLWEAPKTNNPTPTDITWPQALRERWKKDIDADKIPPLSPKLSSSSSSSERSRMCTKCIVLPINNGKELPGESLVTDFESDLFVGTILVRLKDCHGTTIPEFREVSDGGYFHNLHRRYQVVIRGQFKQRIPWTECIAGFQLERPCGKLPPKWIVNGALNVVRFFAPQLQTNITGLRPFSLTPLGSTPQSLIVQDMDSSTNDNDTNSTSIVNRMKCDVAMEVPQEEPFIDKNTLIGHASTASSSMQRARHRKKHFDKMYADAHHHTNHNSNSKSFRNTETLYTDQSKIYTFEFLQHLLSFDDFTIELGSIVGSIPLQNVLNGQPLQIMSSLGSPTPLSSTRNGSGKSNDDDDNNNNNGTSNLLQNRLWCFDIWHEMLYNDAKAYNDIIQQAKNDGQVQQDLEQYNDNSIDDDDNLFCQVSPT